MSDFLKLSDLSKMITGNVVWVTTTNALTVNTYHKVDFSSIRTLTLPSAPAENDFVEIMNVAGDAEGSTISRNTKTIMGLSENVSIDVNFNRLKLVYVNSTWRVL